MADMIVNGTEFNVEDIKYSAPKANASGGKSINILNKKTSSMLRMSTPLMLTWGATDFVDPATGKGNGKYDMSLQFPRKDYSTPETDILLTKFQELEKYIKGEAVKNSMAWFNKKTMTPEVIEALWTPMLKYSKDQQTGEADMTKAPTLKIKLPCWEGKFNCEIYDPQGTMLYPDENTGSSPLELIPKGVNLVAIIQCGGLWFANGKFGCTWRLFQAVVQPKPSMKGKCLIQVSPAAKNMLSTNETSMVIEDDSDCEEEEVKPVPVKPSKPAPVPSVVAPSVVEAIVAAPSVAVAAPLVEPSIAAPSIEAAAEPVIVKKKVVRKKE